MSSVKRLEAQKPLETVRMKQNRKQVKEKRTPARSLCFKEQEKEHKQIWEGGRRNLSSRSEGNQAKKLRPNRMLFLHPLPRDLLLLRVLLESEDDGVSSRGDAAESG